MSLRGQAQSMVRNLLDKKKDYDAFVKALEDRFAPPNQIELYMVQRRKGDKKRWKVCLS